MIDRQDIVSDAALQAPLILAENFDKLLISANKVIDALSKGGSSLEFAETTKQIKTTVEQISAEEKELVKIQNQLSASVAKNTDEYAEYKKQVDNANAATKTRIQLGGRDATQIDKTNASIKELSAALNVNRESFAKLRTEEERTSKSGQALLNTIQKQDKELKGLSASMGKHQLEVGNYRNALTSASGSLQQISPGLHSAASGFMNMTKAALAFIATPIGLVVAALGAAIFALTSYFRGSEEGQNRLNKIMAVGSAIFEQFMNVVEAVGEAIFDAISNPKQAILDFGNFIKDNIINRFEALFELIPNMGKAISLLFEGKFAEAGKVATDSLVKLALGVENVTDKVGNAISSTNKLVEQGIRNGKRLADLQAIIDLEERSLITDRARTNLEVAKLREAAVKLEGEAKKKAIKEAIRLEEELSNREVELTKVRLALAELKVQANGDDKEALNEVARAQAAVLDAEKSRFDNTLKFQKQLEALENKKDKDKPDDKAKKEADRAEKARRAEIDKVKKFAAEMLFEAQKILDAKILLIKQEAVQGIITKEEAAKRIIALEKQTSDELVNVQIRGLERILALDELTAEERAAVEAQMYTLRLNLADTFYNQIGEKEKTQLQKTEETLQLVSDLYNEFFSAVGNLVGSLTERRIQDLDLELAREEENKAKSLKLAGDDAQAKAFIEEEFLRKKESIERQKIAAQRRAAIFDKSVSAAQAGIATALAITKSLPNIPLSIAVGIAGAIQVAAILAKPIPAFKDGVENFAGGKAIVGEEGRELQITPGGKVSLTPGVATLTNLERGTSIIPHKETMQILARNGMTNAVSGGSSYDFRKLEGKLEAVGGRIEKAVIKQPQDVYDERGYRRYERSENGRVVRLDKRYKLR